MVESCRRVDQPRSRLSSNAHPKTPGLPANVFKLIHVLGIDTASSEGLARTLPFMPEDTTAGTENEYQTAVIGDRTISVYQIMSLATIPYGLLLLVVFPSASQAKDVMAGMRLLWSPGAILLLQLAGIAMFLRTGRSQVTGSGVLFFVNEDRI